VRTLSIALRGATRSRRMSNSGSRTFEFTLESIARPPVILHSDAAGAREAGCNHCAALAAARRVQKLEQKST
jgi:hypothetical protein